MNVPWTRFALCALLIAPVATAQEPPKPTDPPKPAPEAAKPAEKLSAWPKPPDKDQVLTDIERVVKAHVPEMAIGGRDALVAVGAPAVPLVLDRYGKERDEEARKRLHEVLVATTAADQTRLLAKEFEDKQVLVRTFALWRASAFPDPGIRAAAEKAWQRVAKQGDKADPDERYAAALCASSTGSTQGLEAMFEACSGKRWDKAQKEIRAALEGCRSKEAAEFAIARLENADRKTKVAVLRMLAGCGDREHAARLRPFLDEEDNSIRVAAINALRGMVDGQQPLEGLSAFESIEMAKEWKGKRL
jgi:hypothetical protein